MNSQILNASTKKFNQWTAIIFIIVFAGIGTYLLKNSSAETGNSTGFLNSPSFMQVPAWTTMQSGKTRYPDKGTYDLSNFKYLAGQIGLRPDGPAGRGTATFFWTSDAAGDHIVGVQGMPLASLIVSQNQLRIPNQGPYFYMTYQPFSGPSNLAANLFGSNVGSPNQQIPGDTILIDDKDKPLTARTATTIYPDDYFAGSARVYFSAPAGVNATIYGDDLTDQFWPLDSMGSGSMTTIVPLGTWMIVVYNSTSAPVKYTLSVTPSVTGTTQ
jgi:hypothetical protein